MGYLTLYILLVAVFAATVILVLWPIRKLVFSPAARIEVGVVHTLSGETGRKHEWVLIDDINRCKDFIDIVAGECSPKAYTPDVGHALKKAVQRGVKIRCICGPLLTLRDTDESSTILDLAKEGKIELYISKTRIAKHYRIGDKGTFLYWEEAHDFDKDPFREFRHSKSNPYETEPYVAKFRDLISSDQVRRSRDPDHDFVLVKEAELSQLHEMIYEANRSLDSLEREELLALVKQLRHGKGKEADS